MDADAFVHLDVLVGHTHDAVVNGPAASAHGLLGPRLPERGGAVQPSVEQPPGGKLLVDPLHATQSHHVREAQTLEEDGIVVRQGLNVEGIVMEGRHETLEDGDQIPRQPEPAADLSGRQPGLHGLDLLSDVPSLRPEESGSAVRETIRVESLGMGIIDDEHKHLNLTGAGIGQLEVEKGINCISPMCEG